MLTNILHFPVQLLEGYHHFCRYLPGLLDVCVFLHEDGDNEVLAVSQVDQVFVVVEVYDG